jgi:hypothetical protein
MPIICGPRMAGCRATGATRRNRPAGSLPWSTARAWRPTSLRKGVRHTQLATRAGTRCWEAMPTSRHARLPSAACRTRPLLLVQPPEQARRIHVEVLEHGGGGAGAPGGPEAGVVLRLRNSVQQQVGNQHVLPVHGPLGAAKEGGEGKAIIVISGIAEVARGKQQLFPAVDRPTASASRRLAGGSSNEQEAHLNQAGARSGLSWNMFAFRTAWSARSRDSTYLWRYRARE